jgi:hypothetical protein
VIQPSQEEGAATRRIIDRTRPTQAAANACIIRTLADVPGIEWSVAFSCIQGLTCYRQPQDPGSRIQVRQGAWRNQLSCVPKRYGGIKRYSGDIEQSLHAS